MAQDGGYLGVTPPLSADPPSTLDQKLSDALMQELKAQNNFESSEESAKRTEVLKKLQRLLVQLVQTVGAQKGLSKEVLKAAGGKVFTYGSYRLGVYGPGSDIDTLMIAPKHVTRADFFQHMPDLIRRSTPPEELPELTPVPDAGVPIIKLEMSGVSIDLIFSNLHVSAVKKDLELTDNNLLRGLDGTDMRCVNGTRVTDLILKLVPETKIFRLALRAVKLWAQRRAIYGNVVGFPGGVAYAMLVARVCQLYPKAAAANIVRKFFFVISNWNWPMPIFLQNREVVPFLQEREWDPNIYKGEKFHLMPIITPAYPCMNSTSAIGKSQSTIIIQELKRGQQITSDIYEGKKQWKDLFARHTFFSESYRHYICVVTAAKTKDAHHAWSGLVKARLRRLITGIEYSDADCVKLVQPFTDGFTGEHECKSEDEVEKTREGCLEFQVVETKSTEDVGDAKAAVAAQGDGDALAVASVEATAELSKEWPQTIWTTRFYLGIELQKGKNNLDISQPISEFKSNCTEWDGFDQSLHSIRIKHVRNYDLPADVFAPGESKPTRKANKKRGVANAGLDENQNPAKRRQSGQVLGAKTHTNGTATTNGNVG